MSTKESVFISGASGFIALRTIDVLLTKNYRVIGSVRSAAKGDNLVEKFKAKFPDAELSYEIVADVAAEGAFDEALKKHPEVTYVLHTASPFSFGLDKGIEEAYLKPAVQGTLNMLKGIKAHAPQVTNVVVTSSFASVMDLAQDPKTFVHTEKTWNPITLEQALENEFNGYIASKKFAEEAAWKFVKDESPNFQLTTITPPYVFGPQEFEDSVANEKLNTSAEIINGLLKTTPETEPQGLSGSSGLGVDVRDVALLHVLPLSNKNLAGKRLFPVGGAFTPDVLLQIVNDKFPELRGKIALGDAKRAEALKPLLPRYDISETIKITGVTPISLEDTVEASVRQILDFKKKANQN